MARFGVFVQGLSPRVRGNPSIPRYHDGACGLSPRVRGNRTGGRHHHGSAGTIPACAGEPLYRQYGLGHPRDYPRVCGGTSIRPSMDSRVLGLSPRVRGNRRASSPECVLHGTIPACAGEPRTGKGQKPDDWDYPRVCGGTEDLADKAFDRAGLSPRVRGNLSRGRSAAGRGGTIPACAGEPDGRPSCDEDDRDYPRVCGGTSHWYVVKRDDGGLSPRVRGNRTCLPPAQAQPGTIPACAGEPADKARQARRSWDYPRVCGGTACASTPSSAAMGLSPRVRGNLPSSQICDTYSGTIPACAGEPRQGRGWGRNHGDYPRVCGGTATGTCGGVDPQGLSPRVRGNPAKRNRADRMEGTIPACAGEPSLMSGWSSWCGDYPRVCGGTPRREADLWRRAGTIPACAGEPVSGLRTTVTSTDYPRVCGGTQPSQLPSQQLPGLSPRVRGNQVIFDGERVRVVINENSGDAGESSIDGPSDPADFQSLDEYLAWRDREDARAR